MTAEDGDRQDRSAPPTRDIHNSPTTHGDHSIAANDIKNVIIRWVMHPSARWLPLLLACAGLVIAQALHPSGPFGQYLLCTVLAGVALVTAAVRVLIRRSSGVGFVGALSLVSVLATVGGWLAFQHGAAHADIDVTGQVVTAGTQPLDDAGNRSLVLTLGESALKEPRERLRLTLAIDDHDPSGPTCLHRTSATVYLVTSGVAAQEEQMHSGSTVDFALGARTGSVRIQLTLKTGRNCQMDVRAASAVLHDS
ncbi:hypothetical protein [Streptomyces pinistramenti]|uniref:hypothetical protein n=1 Tax=Streptomyces pinistramenti TaxID=2884812 RepID=UPI001D089EAB|nr:hypothetical protein [Streptomyces pinistramenti]MCB5908226.1 hypothetical protein [Streptomyces pinistramenti]